MKHTLVSVIYIPLSILAIGTMGTILLYPFLSNSNSRDGLNECTQTAKINPRSSIDSETTDIPGPYPSGSNMFICDEIKVHAPGCSGQEVVNIMKSTRARTSAPFFKGLPVEIERKKEVMVPIGPNGQFGPCSNVFEVTFPVEPPEPGYFGVSFAYRMVVNEAFEVVDYYMDAN